MRHCPYSLRHIGIAGSPEDVDRHIPDDGYVFRCLFGSDLAGVLFEGNVLRIVHSFDAPVATDTLVENCCRCSSRQATNEVSNLFGCLVFMCYDPVNLDKAS